MKTQIKGKSARLYVGDEEQAILEKLSVSVNLSETMVMSQIVCAGLRACAAAGNRLPLPLRFAISEGLPEENLKSRCTLPARK